MKYYFLLALMGLGLMGAGCWTKETKAQKDCSNSQNPYACHLDQAIESRDPAYCNYVVSSKHALCLSAYAEITGKKIDCSQLQDKTLQDHCYDYAPQGKIMPPELPIQPQEDQE
ncbi:hypothetical protein KKG46_01430 [Patescibacteria group bacterium]|nr:hypothetical protein [Patescibacteria group bacterium]